MPGMIGKIDLIWFFAISFWVIAHFTGGRLLQIRNTAFRTRLAGRLSLVNSDTIELVPW
jgi:hypothetical protein